MNTIDSIDKAVVCKKTGNEWYTNVKHRIVHHSPTGLSWGYGGSGPADLALNICEYYISRMAEDGIDVGGTVSLLRGNGIDVGDIIHEATMPIYQDFKWSFIATMPEEGGVIFARDIYEWLLIQLGILEQSEKS